MPGEPHPFFPPPVDRVVDAAVFPYTEAWAPPERLEPGLASVAERLTGVLGESDYPWVAELASHVAGAGGKRLRPALTLLMARAAGGRPGPAVEAGVAVELLHLASLYHDDIVDDARFRRGRICAHRRWGTRVATLGGTLLFAKALQILTRLGPAQNRRAADATAAIWQGQSAETERAFHTGITVEEHLAAIKGKSGRLFGLAGALGALTAGEGDAAEAAERFGVKLGMAFQIIDDLFDFMGSETGLGKECATDLERGIYTLPVIHALAPTAPRADELRALLEAEGDSIDRLAEARALIRASGGVARAQERARSLAREAQDALAAFRPGPDTDALEALARWTVARATEPC